MGSGVLTVSLFGGASGQRLVVEGLSAPIELELALPASGGSGAGGAQDVYWCTHWDGARFSVDGRGRVRRGAGGRRSVACRVNHLTDFAAFIGPPPSFNKMSAEIWKLPSRNPTGFYCALVTSLVILEGREGNPL